MGDVALVTFPIAFIVILSEVCKTLRKILIFF